MTRIKYLLIFSIFVLVVFAVNVFAEPQTDESRFVRQIASAAQSEISIRGLLSCEGKGQIQNQTQTALSCASIQLEEQSTGQTYRLTGSANLQKLISGGITLVSIQGNRTANAGELATINVKQIILE